MTQSDHNQPAQDHRRHAPATARNRQAIVAELARLLPKESYVLEIASGSGEHGAFFAPILPDIRWQPSDMDAGNLLSIDAWRRECGAANLLAPIDLDVTRHPWPLRHADAIFCANMIHIAPWTATLGLMRGAAEILPERGPLLLYGPFHIGGKPTAPSNTEFDQSLKDKNPEWGVRDLYAVTAAAEAAGLRYRESIGMPANNLIVVFERPGTKSGPG